MGNTGYREDETFCDLRRAGMSVPGGLGHGGGDVTVLRAPRGGQDGHWRRREDGWVQGANRDGGKVDKHAGASAESPGRAGPLMELVPPSKAWLPSGRPRAADRPGQGTGVSRAPGRAKLRTQNKFWDTCAASADTGQPLGSNPRTRYLSAHLLP